MGRARKNTGHSRRKVKQKNKKNLAKRYHK